MEHLSQGGYAPEPSDLEPDILEPDEPARRVVHRAPHRKVGRVNVRYFQPEPIEHESQLEKRFVYRAILTPGLRCLKHQPFRLQVGGGRSYTPDFRLDFDTPAVVEMKWSTRVDGYISVFNAASQILAANGMKFYVITEQHVDRDGASDDALLIARYGKSEFAREQVDKAMMTAAQGGPTPIGALIAAGTPRELVMHLMATRQLFLRAGAQPSDDGAVVSTQPELSELEAFERSFDVKPWTLRDPVAVLRQARGRLRKRTAHGIAHTLTPEAHDAMLAVPPAKRRAKFSIEKFFASKLAEEMLANLPSQDQGSCSEAPPAHRGAKPDIERFFADMLGTETFATLAERSHERGRQS